jgi:hypothetical protein
MWLSNDYILDNMAMDVWLKNDLCNDMNNIDMVILSDYEMIKIWKISWRLITKWLIKNKISDVDHLLS